MKKRLRNLKLIVEHIIEHIQETNVTGSLLREVYGHMDDMEKQIEVFHENVCIILSFEILFSDLIQNFNWF